MKSGTNRVIKSTDFERYITLSVQWNRWLLKPYGLWPITPEISTLEKALYRVLNVICYGLFLLILIPGTLYFAMEGDDFHVKLKYCGPLGFNAMGAMKYYSLLARAKSIQFCFESIQRDWKNVRHAEDRDVMVQNALFGRKLVTICTLFMYSGSAFYYIIVPSMHGLALAEDLNVTFIPNAFPIPVALLDTRPSPINQIVYSIQLLSGVLMHAVGASVCSLVAVCAMHANGQMEILMCWLKHLINAREDMSESVDDRVAAIVMQHMRIMDFLNVTENALKHIALIEFLGCSSNMCLLGYYIIVESARNGVAATLTYVLILTSIIFDVFIFCYIGQLVADQWAMIGEMSYMADWYKLKERKKLSFILIIAMSNTSKKLTAGSVMDLSLETFTDVMKTTFTFFNMLRTLA